MKVFKYTIIGRASEAVYIFAKDLGSASALATYIQIENPQKYNINPDENNEQLAVNIPEQKVYFFGLRSVHPIDYIAKLNHPCIEIAQLN